MGLLELEKLYQTLLHESKDDLVFFWPQGHALA
jgi:hypothetical protein